MDDYKKVEKEYWLLKNNKDIARKIANGCAYERMAELLLYQKNVDSFFENMGIARIAIYGVEGLGKKFYQFVLQSNIIVDCFIDLNYRKYNQEKITVIGLGEIQNRDIQAIVIAVLDCQCEILKILVEKGFNINKIYTVNSVLYGVKLK